VLICGGAGDASSAEIYDPRVKAFLPAGAMTVPRRSFIAVTLRDGRVLVAGGAGAKAEVFNPESGAFSAVGEMTVPRAAPGASLLKNGQVLIVSGTSTEIFDPLSSTFSATGPLAQACDHCNVVALTNPRVLITDDRPQTEIYDAVSGIFTHGPTLNDINGPRTATLLDDGSVLVAGSSAELLVIR
jgi:hypothetical protein